MSALIVKSIHIDPINITTKDIAEIFLDGDGFTQCETLVAMADILDTWSSAWAFQCLAIDEWLKKVKPEKRDAVITMLKTLVEHLE